MGLKKASAVLALLTILALLAHVGYNVFCYLTFYYNPMLKTLTAAPVIVFACLHAIAGMCSVFLLGDGTRVGPYQRQNRRTVIQRVSAALIFPLLIVHLNTFGILSDASQHGAWLLFCLVLVAQVAFYAVVAMHVATSFSRALITLGLLSSKKTQAHADRIANVVCACLFLVASFVVVRGQLGMFVFA